MNTIQAFTIAHALRTMPREGYEDAVFASFHKGAKPLASDEILALAADVKSGDLPIILVVMDDGIPSVYADCGQTIILDLDNTFGNTNRVPVPTPGGTWERDVVYRPETASIPDHLREWAELAVRFPVDTP